MISHSEMEKRQRREEREYSQMLTSTESRDRAFGVMPQSYLSHTSEITIDNLDSSIEYLDKLLTRARVFHNQISLVTGESREAALEAYYRSLQAAEDFSIQCLDITGKLLESGKIRNLDSRVLHIVRFFCDIRDETPQISPQAAESLKKIDIFNGNDPFEMDQFRNGAASSICSLATIPSGRVLLKTLFNLRYYDPKLEQKRKNGAEYLPSTMRIFNPLAMESEDMSSAADAEQKILKPGHISKDGQAKIKHGDYRQDVFIIAPIPKYDDFIQSTLKTISPGKRSNPKKLQHIAPVIMGHEMIHTVHISYGSVLMMETDSEIMMDERVTAGDRVAVAGHEWQPNRADVAAFDHAEDSIKEAFMVSEQSLREDFGTVKRHSYEKLLDINSSTDGLTEEERYVYLLTDQIVSCFLENDIGNLIVPGICDDLYAWLPLLPIETAGDEINRRVNDVLNKLETSKEAVMVDIFDNAFDSIVRDQELSLSPEQMANLRTKMFRLYKNKDAFWDMIMSLMRTRFKKDILALALETQQVESATASGSSVPPSTP